MDFHKLIEARYSCRKLSDRPVDPALVDRILEAARLAPTAVNRQPFRIFRMESAQAKAAIAQATRYTFGAGTFLVVGSRDEEAWVRPSDSRCFADVDAAIAATHMLLQIEALGLATTWVGYFDVPKLKALCPAMEGYDLLAIFPIGYAAEDAEPGHRHGERKSLEDLVTEL